MLPKLAPFRRSDSVPKNIVFCADGTWNHPGETDAGVVANTNVYKFFKALQSTSAQVPTYDDGVGADGTPIDQLMGGAIGDGLFRKIKDGYTSIAHSYDPGDQVYIFGFSRGAYTARSLAGMIAVCGLPETDKFTPSAVDDAFSVYRTRTNRDPLLSDLKNKYGNTTTNVEIAMVGVWDTVGALGIPGDLFEGFDSSVYGFLDTGLHPDVKSAYHALSIDERRAEFVPTLWDPKSVATGSTLEQVWFPGVHGDVGGGYAEAGLASIALRWMMEKASGRGVRFDPVAYARHMSVKPKHALDMLHDSWTPLWGFPARRTVPTDATLSNSVEIRVEHEPNYRPANLDFTPSGELQSAYTIARTVV